MLDTIDLNILKVLDGNSRATVSEISKRVGLSVPATSERLKKLEESGVIDTYGVRINRRKLNFRLMAIVFVNIDHSLNIENFRKHVIGFPEVLECHHMAGEYDYMLKVLLEDTEELESFISKKLKAIKGVQKSNTLISLSTLKEEQNRLREVME